MEWARIDGKDYYFNISAHVEWELEPISTRTRTEKAIISDLEDERASGIQPGENWQSDTHGVWYKKRMDQLRTSLRGKAMCWVVSRTLVLVLVI